MSPVEPAFTIDAPRPEDAPALARVHVDGWKVAYGHLLEARWFGREALEHRTAQWSRWVTEDGAGDARARIRIGRDGEGSPIGFAASRAARGQDGPRELELSSLYIDQAWYGSGLGRDLVEAVIGEDPALVWVAEDNPRARRFYEKIGFVPDGATQVEEHLGDLRDVRMVR